MPLITSLPLLALGGLVPGLARSVGGRLAGAVAAKAVRYLADRLCDPSLRVSGAVARSVTRAWDVLELALDPAGESVLDRAEDVALARRVRAVALAHARDNGWADGAAFLACCRAELRAARPADGWVTLAPDPADLSLRLTDWLRFADPAWLARLHTDLTGTVVDDLRAAGFRTLAVIVALPHPGDAAGTPVLAAAVHYYLRREVEEDAKLFQGLAFAHLERQAGDLGVLLDAAAETRAGLSELKRGLDRLGRREDEPPQEPIPLLPAVADPGLEALFHSHSGPVTAVFIGGTRVTSGGADGSVRVWDRTGRAGVRTFDGLGTVAAVVADGRRVLAALADSRILGWDTETGRETLSLTHAFREAAAFAADGSVAVCGSVFDGKLRCLDLRTGKEVRRLTGHSDWVTGVAVSPDGRRAASVGRDGAAKLWDVPTGRLVRAVELREPFPRSVAVLSDGRVVLAGPSGVALVRGPRIERVPGEWAEVTAMAAQAVGSILAVSTGEGVVRLLHAGRLTVVHRIDVGVAIQSLAFDGTAAHLAVGCGDGSVRVFALPGEARG